MSLGMLYFWLAYEILKLAVNHNIIYDQTMSRAKGPDRNIHTFIFFPTATVLQLGQKGNHVFNNGLISFKIIQAAKKK